MNDTAFWIWLLRTLGPAAAIADIVNYFGSPRALYEAGSTQWRLSGLLTAKQIAALAKFSPSESGGVMKTCAENGWQIITPDDLTYPQKLLELRNYPPVLFVWGDTQVLLQDVKIAMVGTRRSSNYGLRVANLLAGALAQSGAVVVSGGALGVDSEAHRGALRTHGKTIAVLGCGLGTPYLLENAPLRREIVRQGGAVISEFLPFCAASRTTFPLRNRIISALSLGTVVVEAGERSGSLITARYALEQGRDVFAVPGPIDAPTSVGCNQLIRDGGGLVSEAWDLLREYESRFPDRLRPGEAKHQPSIVGYQARQKTEPKPVPPSVSLSCNDLSLTDDQIALLRALPEEEPMLVDDLIELTDLPTRRVLSALTVLEIEHLIEQHSGKRYTRAVTLTE